MKNYLLYFLCFVFLLIDSSGHCASLIGSNNCIIGNQNLEDTNTLTVSTINKSCNSTCQTYCAQKFKIAFASSGDNSNSTTSNINQIKDDVFMVNQDRIEACLKNCYNSVPTSTKIRVPIRTNNNGSTYNDFGDKPEPWVCDVNVGNDVQNALDLSCKDQQATSSSDVDGVLCSGSALLESYFDGNVTVLKDQNIIVSIAGHNNKKEDISDNLMSVDGNNIYLCGFKTVMFSPIYYTNTSYQGSTDIRFDPKTNTPISTSIFVKNGDYLSIQYMGKYHSDCDKGCVMKDTDYKINITRNGKLLNFNVPEIQLKDYSNSISKSKGEKCKVCIDNPQNSVCSTSDCGAVTFVNPSCGLETSINWGSSPKLFTQQLGQDDSETQFRNTNISGNVTNLSDYLSELKISYPNSSKNSLGGYFVSMTWRGCHYQDGERLEYTVFNDAILNSKVFSKYINTYAKWQSVKFQTNNGIISTSIKVTSSDLTLPTELGISSDDLVIGNDHQTGKIYFRIKTLSNDEAKAIGANNFSRSDTVGQYYLRLESPAPQSLLSNFVEKFEEFLDGVVKKIFNAFTSNQIFISIIKLVLILYIALLGMMFMTGIAPISQQEGVIRIFKIAIVLILISEQSFEFFNTYLFSLFSFDNMSVMANIFTREFDIEVAAGIKLDTHSCFSDPRVKVHLLCVLQQDLSLLFSSSFWNRIFGLMISGLLIPAIAIIIGIVMYAIVALKVTFLYCMAMLGLTVTLSLSPIFLPLILFKYTKTIFDAWIKQLMVLILQPIFVFAAISLFRAIFLVLIQAFMGVSACEICWFEFALPFGSYCLFNGYFYVPLALGSSPGAFSVPMGNLGLLISLFFVGSGMYSFCNYAYNLASRMINFNALSFSSSSVSPSSMYSKGLDATSKLYSAATLPLNILSIDDKSRSDRKAKRYEVYNKHQKKK